MSRGSSAVLLAVLVLLVPSAPAVTARQAPAGRFIVVLRDADGPAPKLERAIAGLTQRLALHPTRVYRHALHGFAAALDARQLAAVQRDAMVAYVAPDLPMTLTSQPLPANFDRVNSDVAPLAHYDGMDQVTPGDGQRVDADIAILDTGVDDTHPDLNVVGGVDCAIRPAPSPSDPIPAGDPEWGDINGHGTHVAGIAAALDNDIGIVGVAPGARIWSVRIFGRDIRGWTSNLLCGIDWVTGQRDPLDPDRPLFESVNMSMRVAGTDDGSCGSLNSDPVHSAICRSVLEAGNVYAVAAGNERNDAEVYIPASYDEVITVSALADFDGKPGGLAPTPSTCHSNSSGVPDVDDTFADFSTSGHDVDLIAPGVCVYSTYPVSKGSYKSLSGTSMATPAVAGGAALYRVARPGAAPDQVRAGLIAAGSRDWIRSTDPDGDPERLLDVASAGAAADFSLVARPSAVGVHADQPVSFVIELKRSFAFTDSAAMTVEGVPPGGTAAFSPDTIGGPSDTDSLLTVQVPDAPSGTSYPLTIRANAGSTPLERTAQVAVVLDTTAPIITGPATRFIVGSAANGVNVPLRISWTGSDPSGPVRFELWKRVGTAAWTSLALSSPTATSTTHAVPPGQAHRFRVRGVDAAGNPRTSYSPTMTLTRRSESAPSISYKGGWPKQTMSGAYGGSLRYANAAGAQARVAFTGHAFAWLAPRGNARGQAEVIVDGGAPVMVDLHSVASVPSRVVFAIDWPDSASHIIKIRVVGTPGHPRVDLDELFTLS